MKFDKSQDSSWNALVLNVNSQFILAGCKPQKKFFCFAFCLKEFVNIYMRIVNKDKKLYSNSENLNKMQ